jgi:hypothetical protein
MATLSQTITLAHQANLGEDVAEVEFSEGTEVTLLKEWEHHYLVKDAEGRLFNVPKDALRPD